MTTLYTYRDVPLPDTAMAMSTDTMEERLRELVAEPWQVWGERTGQRLLAYGPWQVIQYAHYSLQQNTIVRVMRWNVRRTSAQITKYPFGSVWDEKSMGPPSLAHNQMPVEVTTKGGGHEKATFGPRMIRSQTT